MTKPTCFGAVGLLAFIAVFLADGALAQSVRGTSATGGQLASAPPQGKRVALIIENSRYAGTAVLKKAEDDALALANKLAELGFSSVRLGDNMRRDDMTEALDAFGREAKTADWAVVYYAGYGIEISGSNFLIPVDAPLGAGVNISSQAVPLDRVLASVAGAKRLRLVILDACRDNSLWPARANEPRLSRGLGRIEPEGATLVVYAARHGQVASEGTGAHSPFVESLLKHMETPGLEMNRLFRRVADEVLSATKTQEPFTYGRLPDEDFYFKPASSEGAQVKLSAN